ncbi:Ubiquinone biosynthesis O-methyltransferase [Dickeya dianthicola]|nr:bifunctional 2-polyprenyl-6-hydroxyphenol methylase/3-demethylubiquinol 3-O-methyltransferase UbiG [Dickeya dianthicola]AYC18113.1 Ubiquinone biosynthesis O-methyltransferase [Dickeya dianthicola]MCI4003448.1 bifunctional 2-polyprenyl-6-hydroxyphenol methylase/3-demethylubiquinol 3-O-methyltransferase UbiG [Dickeya dianthicola]MCI4029614.1 bifunctional 2-polyprenyl-6-hydroxyphenol methylase/3-demethylubiquinol 3-O-methyltransferase UbiG [Dickeya dianthicola]MCI4069530.1 bifunctional 2-polypr
MNTDAMNTDATRAGAVTPDVLKASVPPPNVDHDEIAKFEAVASRWWDLEGEFKPLHRINPLRLNYILERAGGIFGKQVLDVGCGGGILAESMAREGAHVTGLDMGGEPLQVARLHALESGIEVSYVQETVEAHADAHAGAYDVVTCMEMLEHVPDPRSVVLACARLVKPGGHVFFSTINRNAKAWLMLIVGAEYLTNMVPRGTHDIKKFIRPAELLDWVDQTPLRERHMIGLHYNPLLDSFRLGANVDVNYMIHTAHLG